MSIEMRAACDLPQTLLLQCRTCQEAVSHVSSTVAQWTKDSVVDLAARIAPARVAYRGLLSPGLCVCAPLQKGGSD